MGRHLTYDFGCECGKRISIKMTITDYAKFRDELSNLICNECNGTLQRVYDAPPAVDFSGVSQEGPAKRSTPE